MYTTSSHYWRIEGQMILQESRWPRLVVGLNLPKATAYFQITFFLVIKKKKKKKSGRIFGKNCFQTIFYQPMFLTMDTDLLTNLGNTKITLPYCKLFRPCMWFNSMRKSIAAKGAFIQFWVNFNHVLLCKYFGLLLHLGLHTT